MKSKWTILGGIRAVLLLALAAGLTLAQEPQPAGESVQSQGDMGIQAAMGTAFTYQGQLKRDGILVNGACDFRFTLWDAETGGNQIGSTQEKANVSVTNGLFTVQLDFGAGAFRGDARWLQIAVRCPAGSGSYTTLSPRQKLNPAPYALALPGLWTQQNATSPNVIGGYSGNSVTSGVVGATISGGGVSFATNRVTNDYGTVGGGLSNTASGYATTVGGGYGNTASAYVATVGGGVGNTASGDRATVGGGVYNTASGDSATVGGGYVNTASGYATTVGGGDYNTASGDRATVGGGYANTASGWYATVGGGYLNTASADYATIAGGGPSDPSNPSTTNNRVTDNYGTIGGGGGNRAGNDDDDPANARYATVGGGEGNTASGHWATVAGGHNNAASSERATVSGGEFNTANGPYATIGGGGHNTAGTYATVGGGGGNTASASHATIGGGSSNTASGSYATVGGGGSNTASGLAATVAGGALNSAYGDYSFAAGRRAKANHQGSFVWADSTDADFASTAANQFAVRATGGMSFSIGNSNFLVNGNTVWHAGNDGHNSGLDADTVDGLHANQLALRAYDGYVPAFESVTIEIPHHTPFTLLLTSSIPSYGGLAFVQGFENSYYVAITYIAYDGFSGLRRYGGEVCYEGDNTQLLSFGSGTAIYTVRCPGEAVGPHNLILRSVGSIGLNYTLIYSSLIY